MENKKEMNLQLKLFTIGSIVGVIAIIASLMSGFINLGQINYRHLILGLLILSISESNRKKIKNK